MERTLSASGSIAGKTAGLIIPQQTLIWSGRTVSNTRNGMDAHEPMAQPPEPDLQQVGSPQPLAGRFPEGTPKPVLEGLENPINDFFGRPEFLPYQT